MANGREYVNELALELDSMEAPGRRVYLPDPELGATFKEWDRGGVSFKDRFSEILTGFAWEEPEPLDRYDALLLSDEETNARKEAQAAAQEEERRKWWEAVQDTVREDTDLFERVRKYTSVPSVSLFSIPSSSCGRVSLTGVLLRIHYCCACSLNLWNGTVSPNLG